MADAPRLFSGFHPEIPKQCSSTLGWGFHGVSRTASLQAGDRKESS